MKIVATIFLILSAGNVIAGLGCWVVRAYAVGLLCGLTALGGSLIAFSLLKGAR